jgi:hypothetical protein
MPLVRLADEHTQQFSLSLLALVGKFRFRLGVFRVCLTTVVSANSITPPETIS